MPNQDLTDNSYLLSGDKLYFKRARLILPYLVRLAKAHRTILYSELARAVSIPNPRNLNYPLGEIGKALQMLNRQSHIEIPPIQCIVLNKSQGLPGEGVGWFVTQVDFSSLSKTQKQAWVNAQLEAIYIYPNWDEVLRTFRLESLAPPLDEELRAAGRFGRRGESEQHRRLKKYIAANPSAVGLSNVSAGNTEIDLPSADRIDVQFIKGNMRIAVEVKSIISNHDDLLRGLFQCVKYKHLIEAEQVVKGYYRSCQVILALQGTFPDDLQFVRTLLGIDVIDNISIK